MDHHNQFEANRKNWDERTGIHRRDETGFYSVAKLLKGGDKLNAIEAAEIGDISGLRVAHLQCHFGLDSIKLSRRGASVVGLDLPHPARLRSAPSPASGEVSTKSSVHRLYTATPCACGARR